MASLKGFSQRGIMRTIMAILLFHYGAGLNFTKRCFVLNDETEVMWNVTFTGSDIPDIKNTNIVMQTKDKFHGQWVSLKNCSRDRSSIQCEIDSHPSRWRYLLRVVKLLNSTFDRLMQEEKEGHHQSGFRCHPNHKEQIDFIRKLAASNVSTNSVDIAWSFYEWDINKYHLLWVKITVRDEGERESIAEIKFSVDDDTSLMQRHRIPGLNPCTRYVLQVTGHYDASYDLSVRIPITTLCKKSDAKSISVFEITIISLSCVVFFAATPFLVYVVLQRRRNPVLKRMASLDVIDPQDVIDQRRFVPGLIKHYSDDLICPRDTMNHEDDVCVTLHEPRYFKDHNHNF